MYKRFELSPNDFPTKIIRRWAWSIKRFIDQAHQPCLFNFIKQTMCLNFKRLKQKNRKETF